METKKIIDLSKNPELESELQKLKEALNGIAEKIQDIFSHKKGAANSMYGSRAFKLEKLKDEKKKDVYSEVKLHHDSSSVIPNSTNDMVFDSGAKRENKANKGRCDLLPADTLLRLSLHYERGAERYGDRNWEGGLPIKSFIDSGLRHILKYMAGYDDEDHLAAAAWNLVGAMWTEDNHDEETAPGLELRTKRGVNRKKWSYEEIINGRNEN